MSILIDQTKRVLVQGITGREGTRRTQLMVGYGTNVVAGVTPGRGGQEVEDIPVFDTIEEAWENAGPIDVSVLFIPAPLVKSAALEAIDAGVKLLVIVPDRVPIYDVLTIAKRAKETGAKFVGPNTLGVLIIAIFLELPGVILGEAFLSFIGLGISPPDASLGSMAQEGRSVYRVHPNAIIIPSIAIAMLVICANFIADGMRDALDPRTRETKEH